MSDPVRDVRMLPQRIETDADSVQRDLLRLVLTVVTNVALLAVYGVMFPARQGVRA